MKITTLLSSRVGQDKTTPTFAQLFKFFRVKSGFHTISHFSSTLKTEGFTYNTSLFSHWQRGTRTPTNRILLLTIIKIFTCAPEGIKYGSIKYEDQANLLLKSTKNQNLKPREKEKLPPLKTKQLPLSWEVELEKFTLADASHQKTRNPNNNPLRFNFILSSNSYLYFQKASRKNNTSKASFLRQLIEEHRKSNSVC